MNEQTLDTGIKNIKLEPMDFYQQCFQEAVRNGDTEGIQQILEARDEKININLYDKEGQTPLHQSVLNGDVKVVKLLVKFGADTRLANRDGWNALHIAAYGGNNDIYNTLVRANRTNTPISPNR